MIIKDNKLIVAGISLLIFFLSLPSFAQEISDAQISDAYYKSYTYEKFGNYNDAIKSLQLVYQAFTKTYGVNNRLGHLYGLNQQYKNSEHHYKLAITAMPYALSPKLGLMYTYLKAQQFEEASEIGYQVLNIDYYNYYGNLRLGYVLRKMGNTKMAESILIKMLVRYPSDTLYLTELGLLTLEKKDFLRTKGIMSEVLILDPENVTAKSILLSLEE